MQSLDDRFYKDDEAERLGAALTLDLPVAFITEAHWIIDTLAALRPDAPCYLVRNGIDKEVFTPLERVTPSTGAPLKILVEGSPAVWHKRVSEAVAAAGAMNEPHELTVVCSDPGAAGAIAVDRVLGPLSHGEMAALYAEHEVVLKLSTVEGMSGPPLEGFHRGATCVVTPVTGHEEYVVHGYNGLVTDWDDLRGTARQLDLLARDRRLLHTLRCNALETARGWPDWDQASQFMARSFAGHDPGAGSGRDCGHDAAAGRPARRPRDVPPPPSGAFRLPCAGDALRAADRSRAADPSCALGDPRPALTPDAGGAAAVPSDQARRAPRSPVVPGTVSRWARRALGRAGPVAPRPALPAALLELARTGAAPLTPDAGGDVLRVAIVIPSFRRGSGGHGTIVHLARALAARDHTVTLWLEDFELLHAGQPAQVTRQQFAEWFWAAPLVLEPDFRRWSGADVVLATGWQTVARAQLLPGVSGRAYLVQDHEPDFYGASAEALYAADTYRQGLHCVAASPWLAELLRTRYGATATHFDLAVDHDIYRPDGEPREENLLAFYARASTPRRAVPLGLLALEELARRRPGIEIALFGADRPVAASFPTATSACWTRPAWRRCIAGPRSAWSSR